MFDYENYPIIAAVKNKRDFESALSSEVQTIFLLSSNIMDIEAMAQQAHAHNKYLLIHMDFADGLSKDAAGVRYLSTKGIDGIISTRTNIICAAKDAGITCIQRFFMIDSRSVDTALDSLRASKADMIEVMPAIAYKAIEKIRPRISVPIIAGGLIEEKEEIYHALRSGASMVSTGKQDLWNE